MADTLPPVVIELKLQVDQMQQQLKAVTGQLAHVGSVAKESTSPIGKLGESFKEVGKMAVGAFAGVEIVKFLSESAHAAVDNAKSFQLMALQMRTTTGASVEQTKAVDEQLEKFSEMSGVLVSNIRPAYAVFLRSTGDASKALHMQQIAMDVSAATGKDLTTVSLAMSRAYTGNAAALNRLVPGAKNAKDQFGFLEHAFKGAAKTAGDTNPFARMQVALEKIKVSLGNALMPLFNAFVKILLAVMPVVNLLSKVISSVVGAIAPLIVQLVQALMPAFTAIMKVVTSVITMAMGPLGKLLQTILVPILTVLADLLSKYVMPVLGVLLDAFMKIEAAVMNYVVTAFQNLWKVLGPFYNTVLKPVIDGLMSLLGIKPTVSVKVTADVSSAQAGINGLAKLTPLTGGGTSAGSGSSGKTTASAAQQMASAIAKFKQAVLVEQQKYQTDSESLLADYTKKTNDIVDAGRTKLADLYAQQEQLTADHASRVQDITATGMQKIADVVAASKNLLTNAFRDATKIDTGSMFLNAGANIGAFMGMLKDKLTGAKTLADDAAKLSGLGYSQEFIDSIVSQGTQVGDALAQQLITAGPQQAAALQAQLNELNQVSSHGVDDLATQINQNGNLATEDLRNQYVTAQQDLVKALGDENAAYANSVADLTDKMSKAQSDLADALKAENDDYAKSALTMVRTYEVALAKIQVTRDQAAIKALQVGGVTAAEKKQIAAYNADIAAENKVIAAGGTTVNVVANTNASPSQIASDVVNAIKFNAPVSVGA
jgi:hypothetical protein